MPAAPTWSVAVFAHNEAKSIIRCLDSIISQGIESRGQVFVLINGSKDATESLVNDYAMRHPAVQPVRLSFGDKANAWNHYVHALRPIGNVHFFVDGDVTALPGSFDALSQALIASARAKAAGALPATGRDRVGWTRRMVAFGRLAGGLYALKADFLASLRMQNIRIPVGLIGEDLFLSCLVKERLNPQGLFQASGDLTFVREAGFAFEVLSPLRLHAWIEYPSRLVRYQMRDYQLAMLLRYMADKPTGALPRDVETLYKLSAWLPDYCWRGRITPFDLLAVYRIRRYASVRHRA